VQDGCTSSSLRLNGCAVQLFREGGNIALIEQDMDQCRAVDIARGSKRVGELLRLFDAECRDAVALGNDFEVGTLDARTKDALLAKATNLGDKYRAPSIVVTQDNLDR
jgi:hypothetical protein